MGLHLVVRGEEGHALGGARGRASAHPDADEEAGVQEEDHGLPQEEEMVGKP